VIGVWLQALIIAAILAGLAFAAATVAGSAPAGADSVFAAKGEGGKFTATIAFAATSTLTASADSAVSGDVTFAVTQSKTSDEVMWVTNKCFDAAGAEVSRLDLPVLWGTWDSLDGVAGPFATAGVTCTAYATWKPWTDRAISGATMDYSVQN
jgi:hypothetical protein